MDGHHHLHLRKRIHEKLESFPSKNALKRGLDRIMIFIAIGGPLAMVPQVYQTFVTKDVVGLSFVTWFLWLIFSLAWLLYGVLHKDTPIIVSQAFYTVLNGAILAAMVIYG